MTLKEVKKIADWTLVNRHDNQLQWEGDTLTDGEIEYHFNDYSNGEFKCILMRFCDDFTHTYMELFPQDYDDDMYEVIYQMLEEDTITELNDRTCRNMERKMRMEGKI